jgi:hypothetical protein
VVNRGVLVFDKLDLVECGEGWARRSVSDGDHSPGAEVTSL